MKIKALSALKGLDGKVLETNPGNKDSEKVTVGKVLSNILLMDKTGGKMKLYVLAQKFFTEDVVEVDASDLTLIKNAVKNCESGYNALVLGQMEMLLEEVKEDKK